jgi:hypothetical protein
VVLADAIDLYYGNSRDSAPTMHGTALVIISVAMVYSESHCTGSVIEHHYNASPDVDIAVEPGVVVGSRCTILGE